MRYFLVILLLVFSCVCHAQTAKNSEEEIQFQGYYHGSPVFKNQAKAILKLSESDGLFRKLSDGKLTSFPDKFVGLVNIDGSHSTYVANFRLPLKY